MILLGVEKQDEEMNAARLCERVLAYRIFSDAQGKMNLDVRQSGGSVLVVSQFTLVADTGKGTRPSFSEGAPQEKARELFQALFRAAQAAHSPVARGVFGADMQVQLVNDGPVTFILNAT